MAGLRMAFGFLAAAAGLGVVICGFDAARCNQASVPRVAFVAAGSGPYWQRMAAGARAAAEAQGFDLELYLTEQELDPLAQSRILKGIDHQAFDGAVICPVDGAAQAEEIGLLASELKLVLTTADAPSTGRLCYVGAGDYATGQAAAEEVCRRLPQGGKVVAIISTRGGRPTAERIRGFNEEMARCAARAERSGVPPCELVEYLDDRGSPEIAAERLRTALADHPDVACAVGLSEVGGTELARAIADARLTGVVRLIICDRSEQALNEVAQGRIQAIIAADPYEVGYVAANWMDFLCRTDAYGLPVRNKGSAYVPSLVITKENLAAFRSPDAPPIASPRS